MSSNFATKIQRANVIITIGVGMSFLVGGLVISGSYSEHTIMRSIILVPTFVVGNICGEYLFSVAALSWFLKLTNLILIAIGVIILIV